MHFYLLVEHFSNAGIKHPNPGINFALLFALPGLAAALAALTRQRSIVWLAAALLLASGGAFTLAGALAEGPDRVAARAMRFGLIFLAL